MRSVSAVVAVLAEDDGSQARVGGDAVEHAQFGGAGGKFQPFVDDFDLGSPFYDALFQFLGQDAILFFAGAQGFLSPEIDHKIADLYSERLNYMPREIGYFRKGA